VTSCTLVGMCQVIITVRQRCTNSPKNLGAISEFWAPEGWLDQVPYWGPTNIRRHRTKLVAPVTWCQGFVHPYCNLWICCFCLINIVSIDQKMFSLWFLCCSVNVGSRDQKLSALCSFPVSRTVPRVPYGVQYSGLERRDPVYVTVTYHSE